MTEPSGMVVAVSSSLNPLMPFLLCIVNCNRIASLCFGKIQNAFSKYLFPCNPVRIAKSKMNGLFHYVQDGFEIFTVGIFHP